MAACYFSISFFTIIIFHLNFQVIQAPEPAFPPPPPPMVGIAPSAPPMFTNNGFASSPQDNVRGGFGNQQSADDWEDEWDDDDGDSSTSTGHSQVCFMLCLLQWRSS